MSQRRGLIIGLLFAGMVAVVCAPAASQERREDVVWGAFTFGKAHRVMQCHQERRVWGRFADETAQPPRSQGAGR